MESILEIAGYNQLNYKEVEKRRGKNAFFK